MVGIIAGWDELSKLVYGRRIQYFLVTIVMAETATLIIDDSQQASLPMIGSPDYTAKENIRRRNFYHEIESIQVPAPDGRDCLDPANDPI